MKEYMMKYASSESWPKAAKDWKRTRSAIQTKHERVNQEYQFLFSKKRGKSQQPY
jgi:hypothetical protein